MTRFALRPETVLPACSGTFHALRRGITASLLGAMLCGPVSGFAQTTPLPRPDSPSDADAGRFLEQATFGPTQADIAHVKQIGLRAYLNEQYAAPISDYNNLATSTTSPSYYARKRFYENAIQKNDQLRQRVVFALQQFMVASASGIDGTLQPSAIQNYAGVLTSDAFTNFRQIMYDVTLCPTMGQFLGAANNDKPNTSTNSLPNENYARELMQLFTIGIYQLNPDGSLVLDANNQPIYTYDNNVVKAFARVFTGLTYPTQPNFTLAKHNPQYYVGSMVPYESNHDTTAKTLLNGATDTAGKSTLQDVNAGLDNIFNHPNVGPFVARRLIQHLVTSNPSPGYIQRVATIFNNNGAGVRGDMKSVISAILLDGEAVGGINVASNPYAPYFGHLLEPAILVSRTIRSLNPTGDLYGVPDQSANLGQSVFFSPSVFNFYAPDYSLYGVDSSNNPISFFAPEAQIYTTNTALSRINYINTLIYGTIGVTNVGQAAGSTSVTLDLSQWNQYTATPSVLVDKLNRYLLHGAMPADMATAISTNVGTVSNTTPSNRVKAALYLILSSVQYQTEGTLVKVQTIKGTTTLSGSVDQAQPLTFVFRPDNGDTSFVRLTTPDASGNVTLPYIPPGAYHIAVKGSKWLQKVVTADTTNGDMSSLSVTLIPGDANGDNVVDIADFGALVNAYGGDVSVPGSGYDVNADFNCDGTVDVNDFGLLVNSYGTMGDL